MLSFEIVGYAPRSPRDWNVEISKDRDSAEHVARQVMGGLPLFRGVGKASTLANQGLVGVSVWGPVVILAWSGTPDSAFYWDRLPPACRSQRFSVSVTPAASGMEARWEDADGRVLRHLVILNGEVITNIGDAHLVDEHAETDSSLRPNWENRLPAKVVKRLVAEASEDQIKTYDGRRYVSTDDSNLLNQARIVHVDQEGRTWVAVDQAGKVNTLFDPLADLTGKLEPDMLAAQVVSAWFNFRMDVEEAGPPMFRYAWPKSPDIQGLANAIRAIQDDRVGFFALLASSSFDDAADLIVKRYGLHHRDVHDLLQEPLLNLLPHQSSSE